MRVTEEHLSDSTPMGANLVGDGATFRVWAPNATAVHVVGGFSGWSWDRHADNRLFLRPDGTWAGFVGGVRDGDAYKLYVVGHHGEGHKRDPYARELSFDPPFPASNCVVRHPGRYPWHDSGYRRPRFEDLVIYQLHIGVYSGHEREFGDGKFLDLLGRLRHLSELGVNAIQPLPVVEFPSTFSMGYNGTDYFSPEMDYGVADDDDLRPYLELANRLLRDRGLPGDLQLAHMRGSMNQLKAMVDLCHVHGIAVLLDVVYNHAGGGFDPASIYFFDFQRRRHDSGHHDLHRNSLYFTDRGWAGGLVFDYSKAPVRQFLIDNARYYADELHVDGFRYDEVSVIDHEGEGHGWRFCQDLTATLEFHDPGLAQNAEYWPVNQWVVKDSHNGGAGFDMTQHDGLRDAVRGAVKQASHGGPAPVSMGAIAAALEARDFGPWQQVNCVENHDLVRRDRDQRLPRLADGSNPRSWYARSRARVASGLLLTAPGVPMLFMGQEFLEDKQWSDDARDSLIDWDGLESQRAMRDHLRFTRELVALRHRLPALRDGRCNVLHAHDDNRVLVFQRWIPDRGQDVVVAASLSDGHHAGYQVGWPGAGFWREVFNSDVYDHWVNHWVTGNGHGVHAAYTPRHGMPASAQITIPANGLVVFTRDG
jgi:1,4-alpha-glucan branching enzyme